MKKHQEVQKQNNPTILNIKSDGLVKSPSQTKGWLSKKLDKYPAGNALGLQGVMFI